MNLEIRLLHTADRLLAIHAAEIPQKTELCGAFWGLLALRAAGNGGDGAGILDQDEVALRAGASISRSAGDVLPPGEQGRTDYRLEPPRLEDGDLAGTSAVGLARAIEDLSESSLVSLSVRGPWSRESIGRLLDIATEDDAVVSLIANLETVPLWNSRLALPALLSYLVDGSEPEDVEVDWEVGHFVGVLGSIQGPAGSLLVVADTYASLGLGGVHLQPPSRFAEALARSDGKGGGMLVVVAESAADRIGAELGAAGFELGTWDNGSLDLAGAG